MLKKRGLDISKLKNKVSFEKFSDDLLMISSSSEVEYQGILSYWRLTGVEKYRIPPLEIGIERQYGFIVEITAFVTGAVISEGEDINISELEGNVMVDTGIFTKSYDFVDVEQSYDISLHKNKLICLFVRNNKFIKAFRSDRIEILVNCNNKIVGFSVCDLTEDEKALIKSIKN